MLNIAVVIYYLLSFFDMMYSFIGHMEHARDTTHFSTLRDKTLFKLMKKRSKRLKRWYGYIKRNKMMGNALSILFGALELVIVEAVRMLSRFIPSTEARFFRAIDGKWGSKIIPLNVEMEGVGTAVLPSQQILEIAKRTPIRSLNWCYCHHTYGKQDQNEPDRYSCLALGWGQNLDAINSLAAKNPKKKIGKNLTYHEIEEKLKEWNEQGYVHQVIFFPSPDFFYIICACHPDYCLTLSNMKKWGFPSVVKSDFIIKKDENACISCMKCVSRCHFGAIATNGNNVVLDRNKCAGCGLCVSTCTTDALTLIPRNKRKH